MKSRELLADGAVVGPGAGSLSEWGLRQAAAERSGVQVSDRQFKLYWRAGLLGEPDDEGRWRPSVVGRLVRIHELETIVRPLAHRVILLQNDSLEIKIPPGKLREAMIAILPGIRAPRRKMRWIDAGYSYWAEFNAAPERASPIARHVQGTIERKAWRLPERAEWEQLLRTGTPTFFQDRAAWKFYSDELMRMIVRPTDPALADQLESIPLEERVALATIREIALWRANGWAIPDEEGIQ